MNHAEKSTFKGFRRGSTNIFSVRTFHAVDLPTGELSAHLILSGFFTLGQIFGHAFFSTCVERGLWFGLQWSVDWPTQFTLVFLHGEG
jgi:hypothetical protein